MNLFGHFPLRAQARFQTLSIARKAVHFPAIPHGFLRELSQSRFHSGPVEPQELQRPSGPFDFDAIKCEIA
jgi:hypothetical protein